MEKDSIQKARERINRIDRSLVRLLKRRYRLIRKVGLLKKEKGLPVVDREREMEILKKLLSINNDRGFKNYLKEVYRTIFRASRRVESRDSEF